MGSWTTWPLYCGQTVEEGLRVAATDVLDPCCVLVGGCVSEVAGAEVRVLAAALNSGVEAVVEESADGVAACSVLEGVAWLCDAGDVTGGLDGGLTSVEVSVLDPGVVDCAPGLLEGAAVAETSASVGLVETNAVVLVGFPPVSAELGAVDALCGVLVYVVE